MKTIRIYTGEELRQWRHRLATDARANVTLATVSAVTGVGLSTISVVERGLQGAEVTRAKLAQGLAEIERALERGPQTHEELVTAVFALRKKAGARTHRRTRSAAPADQAQSATAG